MGTMRIIPRTALHQFVDALTGHKDQPAVKSAVDAWFAEVRKAHWKNTADVRKYYSTVSVVSSDRLVFNIKGNDYRLVVAVDHQKGIVWIKGIGNHGDYDQINAKEVDHND